LDSFDFMTVETGTLSGFRSRFAGFAEADEFAVTATVGRSTSLTAAIAHRPGRAGAQVVAKRWTAALNAFDGSLRAGR
jgi:hypothetical protein